MSFNWIDLVSLSIFLIVGSIQYARGIKDLSQVLYEAVFLAVAVLAATLLIQPVSEAIHAPPLIFFLLLFLAPGVGGLMLATALNKRGEFSAGRLNAVFSIVPAGIAGVLFVRVFLHALHIVAATSQSGLGAAMRSSWIVHVLLYSETLRPLLLK